MRMNTNFAVFLSWWRRTSGCHNLIPIIPCRHPERSEGSTLSAQLRPFPWILRTAQDDGVGRLLWLAASAPAQFLELGELRRRDRRHRQPALAHEGHALERGVGFDLRQRDGLLEGGDSGQ